MDSGAPSVLDAARKDENLTLKLFQRGEFSILLKGVAAVLESL